MPLSQAADLPVGTATFLFTDIQGSTKLAQQLGDARWGALLEQHYKVLRQVFAQHDGKEVNTEGDAFFIAFHSAGDAALATVEGQQAIAATEWPPDAPIRVRMGLHTGEATIVGGDYVGLEIHRAARIAATGHGGQVVMSELTRGLVESTLPPGVDVVDLGEHRLKDLARKEHLYQLRIDGLQSEFPPLKSLDFIPNNLPTQMTSFVGRDIEVVEAGRLLGQSRLLTLTGPGGTGKTRLSMQVAAEASDRFKDGVYFVPLAPVSDPDLVASAIADQLKLVQKTARPPLDAIQEHLQERTALLVLDNFEQVLEAAAVVGDILKAAPGVKVIATSRAPLRVYGEQEFPVPPLRLPDVRAANSLDAISQFEAVRLFIDRAVAVKPDFQVTNETAAAVAGICALVDGLPLAIELAAARIRLLPPDAILKRLEQSLADLGGGARDLPARQQTLRGAIAWSHDILDDDQRTLMARFSVFSGGAQLEEIERICGPELGLDVLDGLEALLQQNLLRASDVAAERFFMLHVIREFAMEKLAESHESEAVGQRHAQAYLDLAETLAPKVTSKEQGASLNRLDLEHDNLRAALTWFHEHDEVVPALRLVSALWRFWTMRGHVIEGVERIDRALATAASAEHPQECMKALEAAGGMAWWQGEIDSCIARYEAALDLARAHGDKSDIARNLYNLSFPYGFKKDSGRGLALVEEAIEIFQELGEELAAARAMWFKASQLVQAGQLLEEAVELNEAAVAIFRRENAVFDLTWGLHGTVLGGMRVGRLQMAHEAALEGLELVKAGGDIAGLTVFLVDISDLAFAEGDVDRAIRLKGASALLQEQTGSRVEARIEDSFSVRIDAGLETDPARYQRLLEEGRRLDVDQAVAYARGGPWNDEDTAVQEPESTDSEPQPSGTATTA